MPQTVAKQDPCRVNRRPCDRQKLKVNDPEVTTKIRAATCKCSMTLLERLKHGDLRALDEWRDDLDAVISKPAGWTLVHFAAAEGLTDLIHELARKGASLQSREGDDGYQALHLAARFGHSSAVDALCSEGAAVSSGDAVSALLKSGFRLKMVQCGFTPLHYAAAYGFESCVRILLGHGADRSPLAADQSTPAVCALAGGHPKVAELLQQQSSSAAPPKSGKQRLKDWLSAIGLVALFDRFIAAGFDDVDFIAEAGLDSDDLTAIGVDRQGHRKKLQAKFRIEPHLAAAATPAEAAGSDDDEDDSDDGSDDEDSDEDSDEESDSDA